MWMIGEDIKASIENNDTFALYQEQELGTVKIVLGPRDAVQFAWLLARTFLRPHKITGL